MTFPQVLAVIVIGAVAHACGQTLRDAFRDYASIGCTNDRKRSEEP